MPKRRKLISSMFRRRLLLLAALMFFTMCGLSVQMARLSIVQAAEHRMEAEARLDRIRFLPTVRGKIIDRKGRVLAEDVPSDDVAIEYSVITGAWAYDSAAKLAKKTAGNKWSEMSSEAREAAIQERLPAQRAVIEHVYAEIQRLGRITRDELDQRLDSIKREVHSLRAEVWDRQQRAEMLRYGEEEAEKFEPEPIREEEMAHVVLPRVSQEVVFEARRLELEFPGMIEVQQSTKREYLWLVAEVWIERASLPPSDPAREPISFRLTGVADHIIGSMRDEVFAEDVARRPFLVDRETREYDLKGYRAIGDTVGERGIERVFEDRLRGTRGMVREHIDTGAADRTEPAPGSDVQLTIDIQLQARVQAILSPELGLTQVQPWHEHPILEVGTPLNSAAVVIDVESGEVLAMVSMPTFGMANEMTPGRKDRDQPWVNRTTEAIYPPGSILKPFVLAAAVGGGKLNLAESIQCTGHYFPDKEDVARCWIFREQYGFATHASLQTEEALARSCNIFFYTIAERTGIRELAKWFRAFGLGQGLDVGLRFAKIEEPDQAPGADSGQEPTAKSQEPSLSWVGESNGTLITEQEIARLPVYERLFETVSMGIGQGRVTWTPVQAANAYAMLARGGSVRDAALVMQDQRTRSASLRTGVNIAPRTLAAILEGLRQSVEESYGTGHNIKMLGEPIINAAGVTVWAKTGTAQAPPGFLIDTNQDGRIVRDRDDPAYDAPITELDHSWFVGLVGPKQSAGTVAQPKYAIAVVVEYGGSGGRVAGPVANQIIRALQAEGYLPEGESGEVAHEGSPALRAGSLLASPTLRQHLVKARHHHSRLGEPGYREVGE